MSVKQLLSRLTSHFHSAAPVSGPTQQDVENCQRLSEVTGLEWTPVSFQSKDDPSSNYVSYHSSHTDTHLQAACIADEIRETLGNNGRLSMGICTASHPGWGNYVYIAPKDFAGFSERLESTDPDAFQDRLVAAIQRANDIHDELKAKPSTVDAAHS